MSTVTSYDDATRVERYADMIRGNLSPTYGEYPALVGMIDSITDPTVYNPDGAGDRIERVRDALAAAKLVRAEMRAAR